MKLQKIYRIACQSHGITKLLYYNSDVCLEGTTKNDIQYHESMILRIIYNGVHEEGMRITRLTKEHYKNRNIYRYNQEKAMNDNGLSKQIYESNIK